MKFRNLTPRSFHKSQSFPKKRRGRIESTLQLENLISTLYYEISILSSHRSPRRFPKLQRFCPERVEDPSCFSRGWISGKASVHFRGEYFEHGRALYLGTCVPRMMRQMCNNASSLFRMIFVTMLFSCQLDKFYLGTLGGWPRWHRKSPAERVIFFSISSPNNFLPFLLNVMDTYLSRKIS